MNDAFVKTAAALLVTAGVAAEANLLRAWIAEWRQARRERQRRGLWARAAGPTEPGGAARCRGFAAAGACLMLLGPASMGLAQETAATGAQPAGGAGTPTTPGPAAAAPPLTISTDRPSFSDGTGIEPLRHLNIETGYTFTHRDRDDVKVDRQNGPEVLARVGLIDDRLEVRLSWSGWVDNQVESGGTDSTSHGWSDLTVGLKVKLFDQAQLGAWAPRLALGLATTVGAGGGAVSSQESEPIAKLLWSYDLGACWGEKWSGWSAGGNFNIAWPTSGEGTDHFEQFQASLCVNAPLFDGCTGFAEWYVLTPNTDGGSPAHYADIGAAYLLSPRVQLDARVGFGLNNQADNFFAGVGLSVLF